ncbi:hypothetical protein ACERK3_06235 [Phycisphaerales bacterium AB-hyl4]|uniref:Lipoprotein n=1 Tax=Natronomicrosphaera hydrolytica TaxID=3242702 RepID=A0ABV4U6K1_9BACT
MIFCRPSTVASALTRRRLDVALLALMLLTLPMLMVGCNASQTRSNVQMRSVADRSERIDARFDSGMYRQDDESSATMILLRGPAEQPTKAMVVRLHWVPRAGATPLESSATNATMHYIIFGEGEASPVAIYSAAGFVFPRDRLGRDTLRVRLLDAKAHLADAADGFDDRIGPSRLSGDMTVAHDPEATSGLLDQIHALIHERLGRPRLVLGE